MNEVKNLVHILLPILSLLLLILGVKNNHRNYVILSFWSSLIALIIQYELAGAEILGYYFNYLQASIYTLSLLTLAACIIYFVINFKNTKKGLHLFGHFFAMIASMSILILLINLWMNAYFIENRMPGTPLLQVSVFTPLDYCTYRYVFYKINQTGDLKYMCPNHYGLVPSVGYLTKTPDFLIKQLPPNLGNQFKH